MPSNKSKKKSKVILWGGRSKANIVANMLNETKNFIPHLIFDNTLEQPEFETDIIFCSSIKKLNHLLKDVSHFVVCIGGEHGYARCKTADALLAYGLLPIDLIHTNAYVDKTAQISVGIHVMPGAVIHKFVTIGEYSIINTNSTVDHDCLLGKGVHIMGGAALAGQVKVGNFATIGTNATILPRIEIGEGAYIGAGAVVTKNVKPYEVVIGSPARYLRKKELKFDKSVVSLLAKDTNAKKVTVMNVTAKNSKKGKN
jgi:sugar O-acyltransferase (sialic acid O-acetyltransferase NeuD family)